MTTMTTQLKNHDLLPNFEFREIRYETKPVKAKDGSAIDGLHQVWISLDNQKQLNSYTTAAVKEVILAFRKASNDRRAVAVVFTATGDRAFCTGGNTEEYATYYAQRPTEYAQYMRLFNDMVTGILLCDKPVICRVNGMRIAGGQEIGMACDYTIAGDHARFGQAGPLHGSAPDGGATDMLDLFCGVGRAAESLVMCEPWSAHKAYRMNVVNEVVPVYKTTDGKFIGNPLVVTDRQVDEYGRMVYGEMKSGADAAKAKEQLAKCAIDLSMLDEAIDRMVTKLTYLFPDCTRKTLESLRKKKLSWWQQNCETNRSWLALNMNNEGAMGFSAFHYAEKTEREADFVTLRKRIAEGTRITTELMEEVLPPSARAGWKARD